MQKYKTLLRSLQIIYCLSYDKELAFGSPWHRPMTQAHEDPKTWHDKGVHCISAKRNMKYKCLTKQCGQYFHFIFWTQVVSNCCCTDLEIDILKCLWIEHLGVKL